MLNEIVTRALIHLTGAPPGATHPRKRFHYAYASDDGHYVAIRYPDRTTYVIDLDQGRYCAQPAGEPRGFDGHVLEMRHDAPPAPLAVAREGAFFDLDMDHDDLPWRASPGATH